MTISKTTLMRTACGLVASAALVGDALAQPAAIQEIVVTAQKRSENIQDVPIAVTAIGGETLKTKRTLSTTDIQFLVPSLQYNDLGGYAQPFLRGIGSDFTAPNADASVATYIDGAYVATDQATITNLLGVERIEVLAGPQGTLYGRNAVGGAINIITLTPSQETSAKLQVGYGNFNNREVSGHISGAVTKVLSVGIYGASVWRDPYMESVTPRRPDTVETDREWGGRIKAVWEPSEFAKVTLSVEETYRGTIEDNAFRQLTPKAAAHALFGAPVLNQRYRFASDTPVYGKNDQKSATLKEEIDFGWANFLGISNIRRVRAYAQDDQDGTAVPLILSSANPITSEQWSHEFQVLSPAGQRWKWVAGLYYFNEMAGYDPLVQGSTFIFPAGIEGIISTNTIRTHSYAAFAQTDIPLDFVAEGLSLTLGGRYSYDVKNFVGNQTLFGTGAIASCGGEIRGLSANCATVVASFQQPSKSTTWSKFSPKVTLSYKTGESLFYATYSHTYKSGAYNAAVGGDSGPVAPETLTDYEAGVKTTLLNGRLQLNTAAYYYDFKDIQTQILVGGVTSLQNGGDGTAYGLEESIVAALSEDLTATLGLSLEHSEYKNYPAYAGVDLSLPCTTPAACIPVGLAVNVNGNEFQRTPKFVISMGLNYNHTLPDGGQIHANIDWYHNGGFFWTPQNGELSGLKQGAYDLVNAGVGYTLPNGNWNVRAWVNNLTNEYYSLAQIPIGFFGGLIVDAPPRMYGATLTYSFN